MEWLFKILIALSIIPIQTVFLEKIQIGGVKPDAALVFVFVQGWVWGAKKGFLWGLALGGMIDLFSTGMIGVTFVMKGLIGVLGGMLGKSFLHLSLQAYVLLFLMVSLLHDIAGVVFLHGLGLEELTSLLTGKILIRAIYNTVFAIVAILIVWEKFSRKGTFEYGGAIFSPGRRSGTRR
ncbi:MAG: hypothetical protein ACE5F7_00230 [Nitrospiria bacterium]